MTDTAIEIRMYLMQAGPKLFAFGDDPYGPSEVPWDFTKGDPKELTWTNGDQSWSTTDEYGTVNVEGMDLPAAEPGEPGPEPGVLYQIFLDYFGNITHKTTVFDSEY